MSLKKIYAILNTLAFVLVIYFNYLSNTGAINDNTIAEVSANYNTLFTPAGYAFSIWGLIYLLLLGFIINQLYVAFNSKASDNFIAVIGPWFILSCAANIGWIYSWLFDSIGVSLLCMFIILISLLVIVVKNNMELSDPPFKVILFLWWPFVIYSGWITVASIANVSSYLQKIDWDAMGIDPTIWTMIVIFVAVVINLLVTWKRNMREFALVGAWALIAIAVANQNENKTVALTAVVCAGVLLLSSGLHAFKNRSTIPLVRKHL